MNAEASLVGSWCVDPGHGATLDRFGDVTLHFREDGSLDYVIAGAERDQVIQLRYKVDGSDLVTDQPSAPSVERTRFGISDDGKLTLEYGGFTAYYVRCRVPSQTIP